MDTLQTIITVIQLLSCIVIICIVLLQSGKSSGLSGAIGGGSSDSFMAKNKTKSFDARLARLTKWAGAVFIVLTLILNFI
ncbi:MAG: preprotein translocase subunit SecG [Oscillospiraceae bacterium]